jgi:uncharacterized protein
MNVFFDSSALVKRYIEERGSSEVESILRQASSLGVSIICYPEIISALCRLKRERILSMHTYVSVRTALMEDLADATICTIAPAVIKHSVALLESNTLRAMDSLHIGCALVWQADLFVSADQRQIAAAKRAGLNTQRL